MNRSFLLRSDGLGDRARRVGIVSCSSAETVASIFFLVLLLTSPLVLIYSSSAAASDGPVLAVKLDSAITPASDDIVVAAIQEAELGNYQAVLIILDTPGGGLEETFSIIDQVERTRLPVIGYVYPDGAKAWSAGTLILMSSDVAAMAPHTIIGSAQPVQLSPTGGTVPINDSKTINAIVALIEEKAKKHGRNSTAAREFVLSNLNLNADDAKKFGSIEYVSSDPQDLLRQINGLRVKNVTLSTTNNSEVVFFEPPINLQFLKLLSDPMIAGLLILIGLYGIIFGLSSPGLGAEAFGVIALALGLIGQGFDVNLGGLFLMLVGVALILMELHSHSFGILAAAGLICITVGSILLIPTSYPQWYIPGEYQRSLAAAFILPSLILGGFLAFAVYKIARIRFAPPVIGLIIGEEAEALDRLAPGGYVSFHGEYWKAEAEETVEKGEKVVIAGKDGAMLKVRRK
jgi:membrane-bound serine protease (ClpP class)